MTTMTTSDGFAPSNPRGDMPWEIVQHNGQHCLRKKGTTAIVKGSCHASRADTETMMAALYANEGKAMDMNTDFLIGYGSEVKMLSDGAVGGYLVRFGAPDLVGDVFTADTDFGFDGTLKTPIFLNHRLPLETEDGKAVVVKSKIGEGVLTKDDSGILIRAILYERKKFQQALAEMGWSSGTAAHLVDRVKRGKSRQVKTWPLGLDASLTPTPCDPGNICTLKSYAASSVKSLKGVFADSLQEDKNETYDLWNAVRTGAARIVQAASVSDVTGVTVDVTKQVEQLVADFAAELAPAISAQIKDHLSGKGQMDSGAAQMDHFYLRSWPGSTGDDGEEFFESVVEPVEPETKATWDTAYKNDLPDSAFAYVEPGGEKKDGKTLPRSLRHFPYRDKEGKLDEVHVRAALGGHGVMSSNVPDEAKAKALGTIRRAAKTLGIEVASGKSMTFSEHFDAVATSVESMLKTATGYAEDMSTFAVRVRDRLEFREIKDGRTISTEKRTRLTEIDTALDSVVAAMQTIGTEIKTLLELAVPRHAQIEAAKQTAPATDADIMAAVAAFEELQFNRTAQHHAVPQE
jgi:hypothetical protein